MRVMIARRKAHRAAISVATVVIAVPVLVALAQTVPKPKAKVVELGAATQSRSVLAGPPDTVTMRSGYVVLAPAKSVGKHSTGGYEEVVVVFEGEGKMTITDGPELTLTQGSVAYCPPRKEHDVTNTGSQPLRYLYVVAAAPSTEKQ